MSTIKHYTNYDEILEFKNANPNWIAGFTNGEGCEIDKVNVTQK